MQSSRDEFIKAATWHGDLAEADAILAADATIKNGLAVAAILGDEEKVKQFVEADPSCISETSGPYDTTALVYLCMSKYLRLKRIPEEAFINAASILLEAGADPNAGFLNNGEFETALYGAAGVAQNAELTKLLLDHGADPNDDEACYHSPENWENGAMKALVETGRLTPDNLAMMLIRKHDWHDYEGQKYLLEHGTDPNVKWRGRVHPLHHALKRANGLQMIELLLDHGADATALQEGLTGLERAASEGRGDVLQLFYQRRIDTSLQGVYQLIGLAANGNVEGARTLIDENPGLLKELLTIGSTLLARFSVSGNAEGIRVLLELGIPVNASYWEGDGYYEIPKDSLPIHIASRRGWPEVVKVLIEYGADVNAGDANGLTPLVLAIKACTSSYWMVRRSPDSVKALLEAGAQRNGVNLPTGYDAIDTLLR